MKSSGRSSVVSCQKNEKLIRNYMSGLSYKELLVWQRSMKLVTDVYKATSTFPKSEMFGLASQLNRAAVSIPSNIAEGQGRNSTKEFLYHLSVAYGSLMEVETQVQIAANLSFVNNSTLEILFTQCREVGRMLNGLTKSLRAKATNVDRPNPDHKQLTTDN